MRRLFIALAPLALLAIPAPAHAAAGTVVAESTATAYELGAGVVLVTAICDARASAGAVATSVSCSIRNTPNDDTRAFPGSVAVAAVSGVAPRPAYVCHSALAVFYDGSTTVSPLHCDRIAP